MADYPKIRFTFDLNTDKKFCLYFLRRGWNIHPSLKYLIDCPDEEIVKRESSEFIDNFYQKNFDKISINFNQAIEDWFKVEKSYFSKVGILLNNYPWPQGDYMAVGSVLDSFPRNIKDKSFTFPVNNQLFPTSVIAHEMLHFIVYDYMEKVCGLEPSECFSKDNRFWQFTENLNALIEDEPIWQEFMNGQKAHVKKNCQDLYQEMKNIWDRDKNINSLIEQVFFVKK